MSRLIYFHCRGRLKVIYEGHSPFAGAIDGNTVRSVFKCSRVDSLFESEHPLNTGSI